MPKYLDLENWNRKELFYFFKDYDNPFYNICTDLDVTKLYRYVKDHKISFFQTSLYLSLKAANNIEEFHYRIKDDKVIVYETIHSGSTILNKDDSFSFCYFDYYPDFKQFAKNVLRILEENERNRGALSARENQDDLIHYSMIPWISFTSFSHARKFNVEDSIPKIVFGKYYKANNSLKMPVSVEVHHSLIDGLHVGKFFDLFQQHLNDPLNLLK